MGSFPRAWPFPAGYRRKRLRFNCHDYRHPSVYFVTVNAYLHQQLFGQVVGGKIVHNEYGRIVQEESLAIPEHFPGFALDEFVVMPNHVHGILTEYLRKEHGGSMRTLRDAWVANGWLITPENQGKYTNSIRIGGTPIECYIVAVAKDVH